MTHQGLVCYCHLRPLNKLFSNITAWVLIEVTGEGEGVEASGVEAAVAAIAIGMDEGTIRLLQRPDDDG
jgi:hypothetical protein